MNERLLLIHCNVSKDLRSFWKTFFCSFEFFFFSWSFFWKTICFLFYERHNPEVGWWQWWKTGFLLHFDENERHSWNIQFIWELTKDINFSLFERQIFFFMKDKFFFIERLHLVHSSSSSSESRLVNSNWVERHEFS